MKTVISLVFLTLLVLSTNAQNWEVLHTILPKTQGAFAVNRVEAHGAKLYVVGAFTGNIQRGSINLVASKTDGILMQVDTGGTVDWFVSLGGSGDANITSVAITSSGTVFAGGTFTGQAIIDQSNGTKYDLGSLSNGTQEGIFFKILSDGTVDEIINTTWGQEFTLTDLDVSPTTDVIAVGNLEYRNGDALGIFTRIGFGNKSDYTKTFISTRGVRVNSLSISDKGFAVVAGSHKKNISFDNGDNWFERSDEVEEGFVAIYNASTGAFQDYFSMVNTSGYAAIDVEAVGDFMNIAWQHEGKLEITSTNSKTSRGGNDIMVTRISYNPSAGNKFVLQFYFAISSNQDLYAFDLIKGKGNEFYALVHDVSTMYYNDTRLSNPAGTNVLLLGFNHAGVFLHESVIGNCDLAAGAAVAVTDEGIPYFVSGPGNIGDHELGWFGASKNITMLYLAKNSDKETHQRTSIGEQTEQDLTLYPNPTNGVLFGSLIQNAESIQVFDIQGRLVFIQNESSIELDISHLEKGVYTLLSQLEGNLLRREMVVVE
ncbi:MAG: T9SS type A sorting domain-containing protein [Bacteroidetes bacterium]|nr:T9SS type A sorting domain-containing protein [Bacteroidota bacterium]